MLLQQLQERKVQRQAMRAEASPSPPTPRDAAPKVPGVLSPWYCPRGTPATIPLEPRDYPARTLGHTPTCWRDQKLARIVPAHRPSSVPVPLPPAFRPLLPGATAAPTTFHDTCGPPIPHFRSRCCTGIRAHGNGFRQRIGAILSSAVAADMSSQGAWGPNGVSDRLLEGWRPSGRW